MKIILTNKDFLEKITLAKGWFLNSGIQNLDKDKETYGSFNAWYDTAKKQFSFAYSEITGYGINTLLYLNKIEANNILIERAKIATDWLINKAYAKNEGFFCRYENNQFMDRFCAFDAGMCLNAFVNLYRSTRDEKYLEIAKKIAYWLISKMQKKDGSFYTRYFKKKNIFEENGDKWSKQSGTFLTKVSIGLLNLYMILDDEKYKEAVRKICNFTLKSQEKDGRFITNTIDKSTFIHPHCYTIEGLLSAAIILNDKKYLESAINALNWISKNQLQNGSFPAHFINNKFVNVESPDISSQVMRLYLLMKDFENIKSINLESGIKRVFEFQCTDNKKESHGGFIAGNAWFYPENNNVKHINSWVTMFTIQTLNMYLNQDILRNFNMGDLV
jgi:hypothetical protein